jgi:hypothetical protein
MMRRTHVDQALIPSWSSCELTYPRDSKLTRKQLFAIDLLHAEVRPLTTYLKAVLYPILIWLFCTLIASTEKV